MSTSPTYNAQTFLHEDAPPPPYSSKQSTPSQPQFASDRPCMQEPQQSSRSTIPREDQYAQKHTSFSPPSEPPKKSRWQRLKRDNQDRKAKKMHVTHEEAARMVGDDEEWLKERAMGKDGGNGWVKKGSGGDSGYTIM